jgi:NTE family protein
MNSERHIGLVLSGGSLKAAAHIGAIHALAELGVHPHMVAGTSAGALIAALHAHGYRYDEFVSLVRTFPGRKILDYGFPATTYISQRLASYLPGKWHDAMRDKVPSGLFKGRRLMHYIDRLFHGRRPVMPYFIVSTDLTSGQPVVFSNHSASINQGLAQPIVDLKRSILASCALPGIFQPVHLGPWLLVDGAVRHYAPVHVLRQAGCDRIIVVNLHVLKPHWQPEHVLDILLRSFEVMLRETIDDDTMGKDVVLIEPEVSHVKWTSFGELQNCVRAGTACVWRPTVRSQLDALLALHQPMTRMERHMGEHPDSHPPLLKVNGQRLI